MPVAALPTATRARTRAAGRRTRRDAGRTARRSRPRRRESGWPSATRSAAAFGRFRTVEGFYFAGGALAVWALIVSFLGIVREDFPATKNAARLVGAISVVLVIGAIGSAIYLSATEEHEAGGEEHASLPSAA
jgi:hypothetical protein